MNHQPFEEWILDPPGLSVEQREALEAHFLACGECRRLRERWTMVQLELRQPQQASARYGFSRRWQAGLVERRQRDQRRQAWKFFLAFGGSAAVMLVALVAYVLLATTPVEWVQAGVHTISASVGVVTTLRDLSATWTAMVPPLMTILVGIAVALTFCLLALVWVFALWRTSLGGFIQR